MKTCSECTSFLYDQNNRQVEAGDGLAAREQWTQAWTENFSKNNCKGLECAPLAAAQAALEAIKLGWFRSR